MLEWSAFKAIVISKALSIQWSDDDYFYYLTILDGNFELKCQLDKTPSDTTNLDDFVNNYKSKGNKSLSTKLQLFADKILPNGKKLYTRMNGKAFSIHNASINLDFSITYDQCKINGIEIVGAELGDKVQFKILDTPTGTYSGVANYVLNQFAFDVYPAADFYKYVSNYDADLYKDMAIRVVFDSKDVVLDPSRDIYINYILHEVKD